MAHIVQINNREVIRLPLGRRQIPPQQPVRPVFTEQSWSTPRDDGLLATLLRLDRRSLFTGSTADLEVAYLIPPDSKDASEAAHVEEVCNRLKIGCADGASFRLHGLMNTFLLESSLRVHLDDLASFCITLPFVEFCSLCDQLQLDNQEWSERAKQDPTAQRILGSHEPRLHTYEIQQLAFYRLSPAFLPDDMAIQILPSECRTLDQPCPNPSPVLQKPAIYDELICEIPYPPSLRSRKDKLSPLALLINAHYKLQTYMAREHRRRRCFHLEQYCLFLNRFMDLLYFVPPSGPEGAPDSSVAESTGTSLADASDRNRSFDRGDTPADAHETPDEDDLINGLTTEEMDEVIRQVSNPRATDAARVEAAMLMFGMAGRARQPDDPFRWL
ncbi:hypothetical protein K523DRAFT_301458 [Schizophyllum commune Tattone D]|nr:hypothetical protein K525DRAFT_234924 [Schizophyllum commune Loenen D]KAI5831026.1 hypothetical protein K523DRAFT_301458 [Schizophyllum commune Tattone D]